MKLKFLAVTMPKYSGSDGNGEVVELEKDQTCEFSEASGLILLRKYPRDFTKVIPVVDKPKADHAPASDKQYKKQSNYKGK